MRHASSRCCSDSRRTGIRYLCVHQSHNLFFFFIEVHCSTILHPSAEHSLIIATNLFVNLFHITAPLPQVFLIKPHSTPCHEWQRSFLCEIFQLSSTFIASKCPLPHRIAFSGHEHRWQTICGFSFRALNSVGV